MSKVRINDLARELEVKSKAILDTLPIVGVTEKKTHSSSLEEHEAEKVRIHLRGSSEAASSAVKSARPLRGEEEIKTKIDLSNISRPGDVLRAITQKKEAAAPTIARPSAVPAPPAVVVRPAVAPPSVARPTPPPAAPVISTPTAPAPAQPVRPAMAAPVVERPVAPPTPIAPPVAAPPRLVTPPPAALVPPAPSITASAAPQAPVAPPRPAAPVIAGPP